MSRTDMAELALKMHASVDLSDEAECEKYLHSFESVGENFIGIRRRPLRSVHEETKTYEIGPQGKIVGAGQDYGLYVIHSGTPHHTEGMFGYWHINDVDEVYFRVPPASGNPDDDITLVIVMRRPQPGEQDMMAWYCQDCLQLLYCQPYDSGNLQHGFPGLAQAEHEAVRTFNADAKLRKCSNCGAEHPLGYRFWPPSNSAEEEAARALW